jgi:hypothetical protein
MELRVALEAYDNFERFRNACGGHQLVALQYSTGHSGNRVSGSFFFSLW